MINPNGLRIFLATTAFATCINIAPALALDNYATPTGESVVSGTATFDRPAQGRLNINQSSNRAIINWNNFDTGRKATTEFIQPNSSSLTVNRVTGAGNDPTQILGTLKANGNIMVLDPNGVLFGEKSVVDVNGIIASTGNVNNSSVTGGDTSFTFDNFGEGTIDMRGKINVADSGLAAFVAPTLKNSGTITAKLGRIEFAAGGTATTVDLYGDDLIELAPGQGFDQGQINNSGKILAENGTVLMTTEFAKDIVNSVINMSGVVDVSSVTRNGGKIILRAPIVDISTQSRLHADSQSKKGGTINITTNEEIVVDGQLNTRGARGGGAIKMTGGNIVINEPARINTGTQGRDSGKGGDVTIESLSAINFGGRVDASGRDGGGKINLVSEDTDTTVKSRLVSNSKDTFRSKHKGGDITVSGLNVVVSGTIHSKGRTGGKILLSGIDTLRANTGSQTVSEGNGPNGRGGTITAISDGTSIAGLLKASGSTRGGTIDVTGIGQADINQTALLLAEATQSGVGGTINLFNGVSSAGSIEGTLIASGKQGGGKINITSDDNYTVANSARLLAESINSGKGGNINLIGAQFNLGGTLNASGAQGGGNIRARSNQDLSVPGLLRVDAKKTGNGGNVDLISDTGIVSVSGDIFARGGSQSGNGGSVFFSTPNIFSGAVNVSAPNGNDGTFAH